MGRPSIILGLAIRLIWPRQAFSGQPSVYAQRSGTASHWAMTHQRV
jgi:hypothetical protein